MTSSSSKTASARTTSHYIGRCLSRRSRAPGERLATDLSRRSRELGERLAKAEHNAPMHAQHAWVRAAVAGAAVIGAAVVPRAQQQPFRTGVDLVRLPVVVRSKDGLLTRGLTAGDFEVREDGVLQKIVAFAEGAPGEDLPLHLGLLLDVSGSMELDLRDAASAAVQFVTALDEAVDATLVDFATSIRLGRF
jgi:hypothetical protein